MRLTIVTSNDPWLTVPEEIVKATKHLADTEDYDAAIFAAFRLVEAEVQTRIGSGRIGIKLVNEAFGKVPKIVIGSPKDAEAVHQLFAGALGHIRNDRGHKKGPAVPCTSERVCLWYLNTAALLLYLLSKDHALRPVVDWVTVHRGVLQPSIDIEGRHLASVRVCGNGETLPILSASPAHIVAALPADFLGPVSVMADRELVWEEVRDVRQTSAGVYEVVDAEVPVYSNHDLTTLRGDCVGIIVRVHEGAGRSYLRISPVRPGRYKRGQYLGAGYWDSTSIVSQAWCESSSRVAEQAWTSSMMWVPRIISEPTSLVLSGLDAYPSNVSASPGDYITITAKASETAGEARLSRDVTASCLWESDDPLIAEVSDGRLSALSYGKTIIRCKTQTFQALTHVTVENHVRGQHAIVFEGLPNVSGMAFDRSDDLFFTNQSETVYRLRRTGGVDVALRMAGDRFRSYGYDCIAVDGSGALYLTGSECLLLRSDLSTTGYATAEVVGSTQKKVRKNIALTSDGAVVVGVMGPEPGTGSVLQISAEREEWAFETRDSAHLLAVGYEDRIYVSSAKHHSIDVYNREGTLLQSISHPINTGVGAICVHEAGLFIGGFHSGTVLRIALNNDSAVAEIASGLGTIAGMAVDSFGRLHVGDFQKGRIQIVY